MSKVKTWSGSVETRTVQRLSHSRYTYRELKLTLCDFFSDKRVKVSLFLQDGLQNQDGSIVIPHQGTLPWVDATFFL